MAEGNLEMPGHEMFALISRSALTATITPSTWRPAARSWEASANRSTTAREVERRHRPRRRQLGHARGLLPDHRCRQLPPEGAEPRLREDVAHHLVADHEQRIISSCPVSVIMPSSAMRNATNKAYRVSDFELRTEAPRPCRAVSAWACPEAAGAVASARGPRSGSAAAWAFRVLLGLGSPSARSSLRRSRSATP